MASDVLERARNFDRELSEADKQRRMVDLGALHLIHALAAEVRDLRKDRERLDFAVSHGWLSVPFQEHGIWYSRSSGTRVDIDAAMAESSKGGLSCLQSKVRGGNDGDA